MLKASGATAGEILIINKREPPTFEEELVLDVIEIITVFSARLYGSRSHKGMAANRHLGRAVMDGGFFEFRRRLNSMSQTSTEISERIEVQQTRSCPPATGQDTGTEV